jgi:hypothetical protein
MDRRPDTSRDTPPLRDPDLYRQVVNRRLRLAFIAAGEERSRREAGRPLTAEELRHLVAQYQGDLTER